MERDNRFFYVFINVKGALYTKDWIKFVQASILQEEPEYKEVVDKMLSKHSEWTKYYHAKGYNRTKHIRKICPYNVSSLNRLLDDLKLDYDVNLVITTPKWKEMFDLKTIPALVKNGLNYKNLIIDKTDIKEDNIATSIKSYLSQVGNPNNFIVIDYDTDVLKVFDNDKVINVDQFAGGLTDELVDSYLDSDILDDTLDIEPSYIAEDLLQSI